MLLNLIAVFLTALQVTIFLDNDILNGKSELVITVEQSGPTLYRKEGTKANFISKDKRTELEKKLIESNKSATKNLLLCEKIEIILQIFLKHNF